jgi:hypothetical protein
VTVYRLVFVLLASFWLAMNVLLWRTEFGGEGQAGGPVAPQLVWDKILTAPDDSMLQVTHGGLSWGHCRWIATVDETPRAATLEEEPEEIEGMVRRVSLYRVDVEGNLVVPDSSTRIRFSAHTSFGPKRDWRELQLRITARPVIFELRARAGESAVRISYQDDSDRWERVLSAEDLQQPTRLLAQIPGMEGAAVLALLSGWQGLPLAPQKLALGLEWDARQTWLETGRNRVRAYRLEARLVDRYRAVVYINRVGEILRIELPDNLLLQNEVLKNL